MSHNERNRLTELEHRIIGARGVVRLWYQARHTGVSIIDAATARARCRDALRQLRHYQLKAARLRLRCQVILAAG